MPIFEFSCDKCGHEFEELTRGDNMPICPKCGAVEVRKLMSACARGSRQGEGAAPSYGGGGCGGCSGGNCASCGH